MIKLKYIIFAVVSFTLMSCHDLLDDVNVPSGGYSSVMMTAQNFDNGDSDSQFLAPTRTLLLPTSNGTSFQWKVNDIVGVYSQSKGLTNFFIEPNSISEDGTSAIFNGSGFSLMSGAMYYAFYPYNASCLDKSNVAIHYSGQNIDHNGCFSDLGNYDYMCAHGTTGDGNVGFDFSHIGCVVDFKLQAPKTATYRQVRLEIEGENSDLKLIKSGTIDLTSLDLAINNVNDTPGDTIMRVNLNHGEGFQVVKDSILHVYLMMAPQDLTNKNLIIRLVDSNDNWYSANVNGKKMKAGYTYHYSVGDNSANGGFTGSGAGLPDDYTYRWVSSYTQGSTDSYEDILIEGKTVYAVGNFGIRKIDYTDESNPKLIAENPIISNKSLKGRSITINGNYLYVNMRQTSSGTTELYTPQIKIDFESDVANQQFAFSNDSTLNSFIQQLSTKRDINKIDQAIIFKAYKVSNGYKNAIDFKVNGEGDLFFFSKTYATRLEALSALQSCYTTSAGDVCEVNWSVLPEGSNVISNLKLNVFNKVENIESGSASLTLMTFPCPNRGQKCGSFTTNSGSISSRVIRYSKNLMESEGSISFWVKPTNLNACVKCPLFSNNGEDVQSVFFKPGSGTYSLTLVENTSSQYTFNSQEWFNFKVEYKPTYSKLYYREKECSDWTLIETLTKSNPYYNEVSAGIETNTSATVLFDDVYYSAADIDDVSYVNGKVAILDKSNLSIEKILNLDFKCTGNGVYENLLVVDCLNAINMYDVTRPTNPKLIYTYRPSTYKDIQNVKFFEAKGRKYAFICFYSSGFTIFDVTDMNNISIAKIDEFDGYYYKGKKMFKYAYCFSSVIDYPYVYLTNAAIPYCQSILPEISGILKLDISDFENISKELYLIDEKDISKNNFNNDPSPTRIAKYGNTIFVNNRDNGVAMFNLENGTPRYYGLISVSNSCVNTVSISPDGRLFLGDDNSTNSNHGINLLRIE